MNVDQIIESLALPPEVRVDTEAKFATQLESNEAVKVYAKLPGWFKVPTPLGTYNLDWAVLVVIDGTERLYFVVETKSGLFLDDLRERESAKITCGAAHFKALERGDNPIRINNYSKLVKASHLKPVPLNHLIQHRGMKPVMNWLSFF